MGVQPDAISEEIAVPAGELSQKQFMPVIRPESNFWALARASNGTVVLALLMPLLISSEEHRSPLSHLT
jgi:hypothetical protein